MTKNVLVHVHLYYPEMWSELADCIENITPSADLFVTVVRPLPEELSTDIKKRFANATVMVCENKGFDVAPFFKVLDCVDLDAYDYIVKLHSKRDFPFTFYVNGADVSGAVWREKLLSPVKTKENWEKTLHLLQREDVGMVANGSLILNKTRDLTPRVFKKTADLVRKIGLTPAASEYVAGTMFAAKAALFKCFQNKADVFAFEQSARGQDDALPYACERLLGAVVSAQGKTVAALDGDMTAVRRRWFFAGILHFLFFKKKSASKTLIKVCKIPVWSKKHN